MATTDIYFLDREPDLLAEIGKVTVRWAAFDMMLVWILAVALENQAAAQKIIFQTVGAGRQRIEAFKDVIGSCRFDEEYRRSIIELANEFRTQLDERNAIIHSPLTTTVKVDGKSLRWVLQRVAKSGKPQDFSIDIVKKHVQILDKLMGELERLLEDISEKYWPFEEQDFDPAFHAEEIGKTQPN